MYKKVQDLGIGFSPQFPSSTLHAYSNLAMSTYAAKFTAIVLTSVKSPCVDFAVLFHMEFALHQAFCSLKPA